MFRKQKLQREQQRSKILQNRQWRFLPMPYRTRLESSVIGDVSLGASPFVQQKGEFI